MSSVSPQRRVGLAVALTLPTLITLVYFVWLAESAALVYGPLKALQFSLPLVWYWAVRRKESRSPEAASPQWGASIAIGVAFGALVAAAGLALFYLWLAPLDVFAAGRGEILAKVETMGLRSPGVFVALAVFYSLIHSFLEEYYWRWFVFRECRAQQSLSLSIVVSSLGFMAHHVLVLSEYFGWASPWTYLLSLSVAIGGAFWAWLYERYGTLIGPWLSHLLIDAMIFAIGYQMVFGPAS